MSVLLLISITALLPYLAELRYSTANPPPVTQALGDRSPTFRYVTKTNQVVFPGNAMYDHNIDLTFPDREGKRTVVANNSTDEMNYPICDDSFTDLEAQMLCAIKGWFSYGRRTSKTTNKEFYGTRLSCFDKPDSIKTFWDNGRAMFANVKGPDLCTLEMYTEASMPCSQTQAAAVYCWSIERAVDIAIDSVKSTEKKWSFIFKMYDFKMGRWMNLFEEKLDPFFLLQEDFTATQCGVTPPNYKFKMKWKTMQFAYTGGFLEECDECIILMYLGHHLFPDYICPGEHYSLTADYIGFEDAAVEYKEI